MSGVDSPDYARAIVATQVLLGTFPAATTTADITLPATVTALWLWNGDNSYPITATVTGKTTGLQYPVYPFDIGSTNEGQQVPLIVLVSPVLDEVVTVSWNANADSDPWYVVGDTSMRVTAALHLQVPAPV